MAPEIENIAGVSLVIYSRDHLLPHIHAYYGDDEAIIEIRSGKLIKGFLPAKKLKIVQQWLRVADNRKRAEKNFYELNPTLNPENYRKNRES